MIVDGSDISGIAEFARTFLPGDFTAAEMKLGVLVSNNTDGSSTVLIGGSSVPVNIRRLNASSPAVGSTIVIVKHGPDYLLIGGLADTQYTGAIAVGNTNPGFNVFQSTTSTSYVNLASVGPTVTLVTGTEVLVTLDCVASITNEAYAAIMAFTISGAYTQAASDAHCVWTQSATASGICRRVWVTGITPGLNTFQAKYRSLNAGATANFSQRDIVVERLN